MDDCIKESHTSQHIVNFRHLTDSPDIHKGKHEMIETKGPVLPFFVYIYYIYTVYIIYIFYILLFYRVKVKAK